MVSSCQTRILLFDSTSRFCGDDLSASVLGNQENRDQILVVATPDNDSGQGPDDDDTSRPTDSPEKKPKIIPGIGTSFRKNPGRKLEDKSLIQRVAERISKKPQAKIVSLDRQKELEHPNGSRIVGQPLKPGLLKL